MEQRIALLIDADNVSAKYIKPILDELSQYGNVTYKRIYGDWTTTHNSGWKEELLKNSITPIQQFSYTYGKNATDSAMIIDAMDILYTNSVDAFCIASSDSDFTRLAARIRESGLRVIGMGEDKTPLPFRKACDIFTSLELLIEENSSGEKQAVARAGKGSSRKAAASDKSADKTKGSKKASKGEVKSDKQQTEVEVIDESRIEEAVVKIITENQNNGRETDLSEVGKRLVKLYPDFDVRSYGYSLLSKFLEEFTKIRLVKSEKSITVVLEEDLDMKKNVEMYIIDLVKRGGPEGMDLGALANKVYTTYTNFKLSDFGYSQFKNYVGSIKCVEIHENDKLRTAIYKDGEGM